MSKTLVTRDSTIKRIEGVISYNEKQISKMLNSNFPNTKGIAYRRKRLTRLKNKLKSLSK